MTCSVARISVALPKTRWKAIAASWLRPMRSKRWRELLCRHAQQRHGHHGIPAELVGVPLERVVALRPIVMPRPDRFPARAGGEDVQRHDANAHEREREEADAARAVGDAGKARALVPRRPVPQRVAVGRRAQGGRGDERRGHHCPLEVPERLVVVDPRRLPPGEPRADLYCARGGDEGRGGFAAVVLHHSVLGGSCDCGCCVALSISVAVNICCHSSVAKRLSQSSVVRLGRA